ncbi:MAG: 5-(carboxyamino)imidazole ribonucleotide synthase [Hydrogenophaga sp.]|jgi:5-(carboxyamino)imidazole ribonucleotide synthase|uniref:5-(carboxyamino)imidazole ribonucleotide synthase n=1 Tax=Hydrogenophaga sp. TaxID=1904254 RepID=UPI000EE0CAF3|nr:5-(carboxyamino)imidazole ribonucleotide synthase [Hydrogenophaga sp.]MDD3785082.1 5-(carboxyamino)imidazole ribonucleotide synthase [Hydrogenophaga sp.]MDX9968516.1 5-(carboxyamino)imidazole ribonucleotide synthase [Hydrogenophaga sp.]HAJ12597.1 5-(carboxyamino)imidazole ribonucleotide synthase [Comamonadaceae bacterium]
MNAFPLLPGAVNDRGQPVTLGVMGGGQLGRMFVQAAQAMGYVTVVLDPDPASPAGLVAHHHVCTAYDDPQGLAELAGRCDAITTEFENVPAQALRALAQQRPVAPSADCVAVAQDRLQEKAHFVQCAPISGVHPAPHAAIDNPAQLAAVPEALLPGILKTARLGYDGKGQVRVRTREELAAAWAQLGRVSCVLEKMLPLRSECSVLVARGADGQVVTFPVQKNTHHDGILAITEVREGAVPAELAARAQASTVAIAHHLGYVGVLCVEYFVVDDGRGGLDLVVNEMAPRPHNSGHYSQNACDLSQFEAQVRALAGLPLAAPRQHSPTIMINLLGDLWFNPNGVRAQAAAQPVSPPWAEVLALPGTHLHLYGKLSARRGRKMGHLNITGETFGQVHDTAARALALLGLPPLE